MIFESWKNYFRRLVFSEKIHLGGDDYHFFIFLLSVAFDTATIILLLDCISLTILCVHYFIYLHIYYFLN